MVQRITSSGNLLRHGKIIFVYGSTSGGSRISEKGGRFFLFFFQQKRGG